MCIRDSVYVEELLRSPRLADVQLVGAVDPFAGASRCAAELTAAGVPFYDTLEAFYAARAADLAVVSTPTQRHAEQAVYAMRQGSHVLIEKPLAATGALAQQMLDARDQTGRILAVGFQWCYDPAMLRLKADVDAGRLGRPLLLRALVLWPRDRAYFQRGMGWAGKKYGADGAPIFDCVASNATAHYLENMLWLTGRGYEGAAVTTLEARTARVNDIEMYDTCLLYTSRCV